MEKNEKNSFEDITEFNKKYNHYLDDDNEASDDVSKTDEVKENFEDISSYSEDTVDNDENKSNGYDVVSCEEMPDNKKDTDGNFFTRNKFRNSKIIALCLVIAILLGSGGVLGWIWWSTRSNGYGNNGIDFADKIDDSNYLSDDDVTFQVMGDIDANSLNSYLKGWANNGGDKMYSKNIVNVLLCGVDSEYNLCDAQILVSIDKKNEKIIMTSFLRDCWSYISMPRSDGSNYDYYGKTNAAYHGGPATLMKTLEDNYKIKIDQYIQVDFKSFPKVIDALGGVEVEVKEYEANYIRRTSKQTNFPYGKSKLNGKQALIYSRIRKCDNDSDLSRTRRQRSVIKSLINSAKTATKGQLVNAFKQVSGYLRTGYSQSEVLSLIAMAYAHKWMDFPITEQIVPNDDYVDRIGGMIGSNWCWTVDYPLCAQKVQKSIYGQSNIILNEDRVSALDFVTNKRNTTSSYYTNSGSGNNSSSDEDNDSDYIREPSTNEDVTESTAAESESPKQDENNDVTEENSESSGEESSEE